jgi:hypothetical protein
MLGGVQRIGYLVAHGVRQGSTALVLAALAVGCSEGEDLPSLGCDQVGNEGYCYNRALASIADCMDGAIDERLVEGPLDADGLVCTDAERPQLRVEFDSAIVPRDSSTIQGLLPHTLFNGTTQCARVDETLDAFTFSTPYGDVVLDKGNSASGTRATLHCPDASYHFEPGSSCRGLYPGTSSQVFSGGYASLGYDNWTGTAFRCRELGG